ncbi:MAG: hypothetical protein ACRD0U_05185 [Acidimicrobiales bacterium]
MTKPSLPEKVVSVHDALVRAGVAHAFGGALALAYYAVPRATVDIDVNVFLPPDEAPRVLDVLAAIGVDVAGAKPERIQRDGQVRLRWGANPVDVFFSSLPLHDAMAAAARLLPFGEDELPFLSAEHLLVCKAVFDRRKDWLDIEQMLFARDVLDVAEIRKWLTRIAEDGDQRVRRLEQLIDSIRGP